MCLCISQDSFGFAGVMRAPCLRALTPAIVLVGV